MTLVVRARVSVAAMQHNLSVVRRMCPSQKILAMIKANGYGHGLQRVAAALSGCDALGVANILEAMRLRRLGVAQQLVVMRGFYSAADVLTMIQHDLVAVIHCLEQLQWLQDVDADKPLRVWVKIDTGMHRLGYAVDDLDRVRRELSSLPVEVVGWMTHFAVADDRCNPMSMLQMGLFAQITEGIGGDFSLANSAAILNFKKSHADWVRPGLMLYGVSPLVDGVGADHGLLPVMTLEAPLVALRTVAAGEGIGYGQTWVCPEDMPVGVVGIGYGDGYPREADGAFVAINGVLCPVIGNVSMDMLTIDLRPLAGVLPLVGDMVQVWGNDYPVELLAREVDTIPYTLLTRLTGRVVFCED